MLLCKQVEQGVPLQAEQYDWLANTDEEVDEQELEAHYSYMAKIQEEFGIFTSHDGETMESYYTRFYKPMNEMIKNTLTVTTMQVNVQFPQQLQPEWSRSHTTTRHKGNEIAKPITPPSETASEEDSDPEQA
nr:hypothetical protein [Tanacetum cinerariifolium]